MGAWLLVYVVAGAGAIVFIVGGIISDALEWYNNSPVWPGQPSPRPWHAAGLAVLVALWIAAAVLR